MENQRDKILQWFNQFAKEHTDNPVTQSWCYNRGKTVPESLFDDWAIYIQKYFKIEPSNFLLDVGCGSGLFLIRFKKYTSKLYGVDQAEEVIKSSQLRYPDMLFKNGNVLNAGFKGILFDRIITNSVLQYIDMDECKRALKHFNEISSANAKIWLGDIFMPNPTLNDSEYKRIETSTGWKVQHYPPQFFYEVFEPMGYKCKVFHQELKNKETSAWRYDLLVEKK